jgi:hypothetical protein
MRVAECVAPRINCTTPQSRALHVCDALEPSMCATLQACLSRPCALPSRHVIMRHCPDLDKMTHAPMFVCRGSRGFGAVCACIAAERETAFMLT